MSQSLGGRNPVTSTLQLICLSVILFNVGSLARQHVRVDYAHSSTKTVGSQVDAVTGLLSRLLSDTHAKQFSLSLIPNSGDKDVFQLGYDSGKVTVQGTSGVAIAQGVLHYLKYTCKASVSWEGNQLSLPAQLPPPSTGYPTHVTSSVKYRLYQNVCTSSYSYAFWSLDRWYQEIDWMALNGVNMPLAFTGQEYVWQEVFQSLGVSQDGINAFFSGPGFLAWQRMGNVRGSWGGFGPLPQAFISGQRDMQIAILARMRSFGMTPILPGFAGHVPEELKSLYPNAKITRSADWNGFQDQYCCDYLLEPTDALYNTIGKAFIEAQTKIYGTDHFYSADTFNEMQPSSSDPKFLAQSSNATYAAMTSADPDAVWIMQAWLFSNTHFWGPTQISGYLGGVPDSGMIILDLFAEVRPFWNVTDSFYGKPFIWCMLHNFGGNLGLYGTMSRVVVGPSNAIAANSTIVGVGITMEGIEQNYIMYDMALELGWREAPMDIPSWVSEYQERRYGQECTAASQAWEMLAQSVYSCNDDHENHDHSIMVSRPAVNLKPTNPSWYNPQDVVSAAKALLSCEAALRNSTTYLYDVVDVTRQTLSDLLSARYQDLIAAFNAKNATQLQDTGDTMLGIISDLEPLLATHPSFLLGRWIESALNLAANDPSLKSLYEYNARNQLTLWGPKGETHDYACKQWSGITKDFYLTRWTMFVSDLVASFKSGATWSPSAWTSKVLAFEEQWNNGTASYPTTAVGDTVEIAQSILNKYFSGK